MKNCILLTLFALVNFSLWSQTTYDKVLREQNQNGIHANTTFRNEAGELIITGNYKQGKSHVTKIDSLGNPIWTREFLHSDQNGTGYEFTQKDHLIRLQDSTYLLTRNCFDNNNTNLSLLICFSEDGTLNWSRKIHQNNASNTFFSKTIQTSAGKLLHVFSIIGSQTIQVSRMTSNGVIEITTGFTIGNALIPVGFEAMNGSAVIVCTDNTNTYFIKIDEDGNYILNKKLDNFIPEDITFADSSIYVLGLDATTFLSYVARINISFNQATYYKNYLSERKKIKIIDGQIYILSPTPFSSNLERIDIATLLTNIIYYNSEIMDVYELNSTHLLSISNGPMWGIKKSFGEPQIGVGVADLIGTNNCISNPTGVNSSTLTSDSLTSIAILIQIQTPPSTVSDSINIQWTSDSISSEIGCVDFLGALDENSLAKLELYPNPSNEQLYIQAESIIQRIEIHDLRGSLIKGEFLNNTQHLINTKDFLNGFYIVSAIFENGTKTIAKVLVQHE